MDIYGANIIDHSCWVKTWRRSRNRPCRTSGGGTAGRKGFRGKLGSFGSRPYEIALLG